MNIDENAHFLLGNLQCTVICDGVGSMPVGNVFKDVPPEKLTSALKEHGYSPTEWTNSFNVLTIMVGSKRILVDTGFGKANDWKEGRLLDGLDTQCIDPASIDYVVITHGDADHVGGILKPDGNPVYPNAEYFLLKDAWDFWTNPDSVATLPENRTIFGRKVLPHIRERIKPVDAGVEFLPGFKLISIPGHRAGHSAVMVDTEGQQLLHVADSIGNPLLLEHPDWHMAIDSDPNQAEKDRRMLMEMAAREKAMVFCSHMPYPGVGHILPEGQAWRWQPLFEN